MPKRFDICVLGLGATGYATAAFCAHHKMRVCVTDDRSEPPLLDRLIRDLPEVEIAIGEYNRSLLLSAKRVVVSPGIAPSHPIIAFIRSAGITLCSDIDIFLEHCTIPSVAVTGSNGKSTVVKLMYDMLSADNKACIMLGNIGKPVLSILLDDVCKYDWVILELSSFQLYWTNNIRVTFGAVVNIFPNHLNWHKDWQCYVSSKLKLLNAADSLVCSVGIKDLIKGNADADKIHWVSDEQSMVAHDFSDPQLMALLPETLRVHALLTMKLASIMGVSLRIQRQCLLDFRPWPYRCQLESITYGNWYNDAKSSNLAAAKYALSNIYGKHQRKVIWLAGGLTKQEDFSQLGSWVAKYVQHAIVFGADKKLFLDHIRGHCPISPVKRLQDAIELSLQMMTAEDVVVFSPAAASFDQFENYMHRGQSFSEYLHNHFVISNSGLCDG